MPFEHIANGALIKRSARFFSQWGIRQTVLGLKRKKMAFLCGSQGAACRNLLATSQIC